MSKQQMTPAMMSNCPSVQYTPVLSSIPILCPASLISVPQHPLHKLHPNPQQFHDPLLLLCLQTMLDINMQSNIEVSLCVCSMTHIVVVFPAPLCPKNDVIWSW